MVTRGFDVCEELVKETKGKYCFGDEVTLADVFLIPQFYNAERFGVDFSRFPNLMAIKANLEKLEAFDKAHPSKQPDAE